MSRSIPGNIDKLLAHVKKPGRYIGDEFNARYKSWDDAAIKIALVFPDLYEIGMSHHGLQILYSIINNQDELLADRVYAPDKDLEELLRSREIDIFGVESRRSLAEFDMVGITLPYELCYTNILTILSLARIPLRSAERDESQPLIIGGGSGSFNPEPVADFFDAILLGDGEDAVLEMADVLKSGREMRLSRKDILGRLAELTGVYVPSFFEPRYDSQAKLLAVTPLRKGYEKVKRRILSDLESFSDLGKPLAPLVRIVHDRLGIEVARGCTRGCRFCQAGIIYRPVRERTADRVIELAEKGMEAGGFEELALLSLSTGDYSCLSPVLSRLMDRFVKDYISISMPSMRVGTLTPEIMNQIKRVRKTGFTLAPEAGTDRLRKVINKGITEEDLLQTCKDANALGWKLLKFYFMFGLPTETDEDILAIGDLVTRAAKATSGSPLKINVSVATFVPKPHTPFQWEPQISIDEAFARINLVKQGLPKGNYKLKWHDPRQSFLEGVMSRGDRLLSELIEKAWQLGARLDGWSEHFDLHIWQEAARSCNIDLKKYLRRRDFSEILPWQHLNTGVDEKFLKNELKKSLAGEYTPDCRVYGCQNCGACDFKEVKPVVHCSSKVSSNTDDEKKENVSTGTVDKTYSQIADSDTISGDNVTHHWYRLFYAKQGNIRFLSHLEVIQVFFQAFRRAGIKLYHSQGFNPVPRVSFSPALPVGTESLAEYLDLNLKEDIEDSKVFLYRVNKQLPTGLEVTSIAQAPDRKSEKEQKVSTCYSISLDREFSAADKNVLKEFMAGDSFIITKIRKGRPRKLDIRKQVLNIKATGNNKIELVLIQDENKAVAKPVEILKAVLGLTDNESLDLRILKVWQKWVRI
ncbi:MAG: TIGR03960 family B12-binding radical SAM protein [Desulfobulbales bacterium]